MFVHHHVASGHHESPTTQLSGPKTTRTQDRWEGEDFNPAASATRTTAPAFYKKEPIFLSISEFLPFQAEACNVVWLIMDGDNLVSCLRVKCYFWINIGYL